MSGETKLSHCVLERGLLQAGWQFSITAEVSFVRELALVCRLLAVTTSSDLSHAHVVTSFVLLVILGVSSCQWWPALLYVYDFVFHFHDFAQQSTILSSYIFCIR
jgi:hypothetical protein